MRRLRTSILIIWVMAFAEIDTDSGVLWDDFDLSNPYRKETREYVRQCLGLEIAGNTNLDPVTSVSATIQAFETVGTALRKAYSYGLSTPGSPKWPLDVAGSVTKWP